MIRLCALAAFHLALASAALAGPPARVTLLSGSTHEGELQSLSAEILTLTTGSWPVKEVMDLAFPAHLPSDNPGTLGVTLVDGSVVNLSACSMEGGNIQLTPLSFSPLTLPARQVRAIRLLPLDDTISTSWNELLQRTSRDDQVVIRKGDVLDYVSGSVARINEQQVVVLVRGQELAAPRERVFGLILASPAGDGARRGVAIRTLTGETLLATELALAGDALQIKTASLGQVSLPVARALSIDFGGGRVRMLASLPFDQSASKAPDPSQAPVWFVALNAPSGSGGRLPLVIGRKEYLRGLWLHSGAEVRFRLNREFTRLRATAGFDLTHSVRMPQFEPRVKLVVSGDGKELFSREFRWNDDPQPLDVNLADVRELVIRVESLGGKGGVLEHFALGDAQVIQ